MCQGDENRTLAAQKKQQRKKEEEEAEEDDDGGLRKVQSDRMVRWVSYTICF